VGAVSSAAETGATIPASGANAGAASAREVVRPLPLTLPLQIAVGISLLAIVVIGTWNAWEFPASVGYDAQWHMAYASELIHHWHIPSQQQGGEYYTPPGFYLVAGSALWVGEWIGLHHPERLEQQLNVLFVLGTGLCILFLGGLLFPRRPIVRVAALGFFAFVPVVLKSAAMFYPETLNMFVSTLAVTLATWMIRYRRYGVKELVALAVLLGAGELIRSSSVFTLVGVILAVAIAFLAGRMDRRSTIRALLIGVAALVVIVGPWYVRQAVKYHTAAPINVVPGFAQQMLHPNGGYVGQEGGPSHYFNLPLLELYRAPVREHYMNEAIPTTYAELWDDWLGRFAWNPGLPITGHQLRVMRDQILIGVLPTLMAVGGWIWLLWTGVRRRRELLPIALVTLIAVIGYLYRSYASASNDGDTLKAAYLLITAPMWALGFGVAFERLTRNRWALIGLTTLFVVFAALELRFLPYGLRVGRSL